MRDNGSQLDPINYTTAWKLNHMTLIQIRNYLEWIANPTSILLCESSVVCLQILSSVELDWPEPNFTMNILLSLFLVPSAQAIYIMTREIR